MRLTITIYKNFLALHLYHPMKYIIVLLLANIIEHTVLNIIEECIFLLVEEMLKYKQ